MKNIISCIILWFASISIVSANCQASDVTLDSCNATQCYKEIVTIIVYDGTTPLNAYAKKQYKSGINEILMNAKACGKIELHSIGPTDFSSQKIFEGCIPPFEDNENKKQYVSETWQEKLLNFAQRVFIPGSAIKPKVEENAPYYSASMRRRDIAKEIEIVTNNVTKEQPKTCLINDMISIIDDRKHEYNEMILYCFTDLEDSILSKLLSRGEGLVRWDNEIKSYANHYQLARLPGKNKLRKITIVFWGLGRSEKGNNTTLVKNELENLKYFWRGFLTICLAERFDEIDIQFYRELPK